MKLILFLAFSFTIYCSSKAQLINPEIGGITLSPLLTSGKSVDENTFLYNQWAEGSVMVNLSSKPMPVQKIKYDIVSDKILVMNEQGVFEFPKGSLLGFTLKILDEKNGRFRNYEFISGIEGVGKYDAGNFFLVHYNSDKIKLLTKFSALLQNAAGSSYGSRTQEYVYVREEKLFIYKDGKGVEVKRNKRSILDALGGDKKLWEDFIKVNKLNLKKDDDLIALLKYFESKI